MSIIHVMSDRHDSDAASTGSAKDGSSSQGSQKDKESTIKATDVAPNTADHTTQGSTLENAGVDGAMGTSKSVKSHRSKRSRASTRHSKIVDIEIKVYSLNLPD